VHFDFPNALCNSFGSTDYQRQQTPVTDVFNTSASNRHTPPQHQVTANSIFKENMSKGKSAPKVIADHCNADVTISAATALSDVPINAAVTICRYRNYVQLS
jgi:hypothetical protein